MCFFFGCGALFHTHTFVNWWPSIITHRSNKPNVSSPKQNLNAHCLQMCVGKLISKLQSQTTNKSFTKKQKWKLGCAHTPHEIQIDYVTLHERCVCTTKLFRAGLSKAHCLVCKTLQNKWKLMHTPHEIQNDSVTLHKRCVYLKRWQSQSKTRRGLKHCAP